MSYGRVMSNCGAGMQRLFGGISKRAGRVMKSGAGDIPYSQMTKQQRIERDMQMLESAPDFDFQWGKKGK